MIVVGIRYARLPWSQTTPLMQIPVGAVYLAMPVGFALLTIHLVAMARAWIRHHAVLGGGEFDAEAAKL